MKKTQNPEDAHIHDANEEEHLIAWILWAESSDGHQTRRVKNVVDGAKRYENPRF